MSSTAPWPDHMCQHDGRSANRRLICRWTRIIGETGAAWGFCLSSVTCQFLNSVQNECKSPKSNREFLTVEMMERRFNEKSTADLISDSSFLTEPNRLASRNKTDPILYLRRPQIRVGRKQGPCQPHVVFLPVSFRGGLAAKICDLGTMSLPVV